MARTRKSIQPLNLYKYDVLIEDSGTRSDYFKISQFDGYFYGGRNAFLVAGASSLKSNSKILVEILNKDGKTVYSAPVANFVEGNSRMVQVEVYSDTPIGPGKIVLLGCTETYVDGTPIPDEWKDKYNVRWITDVIISPLVYNKTPIRFVKTPSMIVEEKFYSSPSSSIFSENVQVPIDFSFSPKYYNVFPNGYVLTTLSSASQFTSDYIDGVITGSVILSYNGTQETTSINFPVSKIYNRYIAESQGSLLYTKNKSLILKGTFSGSGIYTSSLEPIGNAIVNGNINLQYNRLTTRDTGSSVSFANIRLVDLNTLSGEINKVRLSYKASTEPGEFVVLSDVDTNVQELLAVDSASKVAETGKFNKILIGDYWYAATMSVSRMDKVTTPPTYYNSSSLTTNLSITQSNEDLIDSINATPSIVNGTYVNGTPYFIGTKSVTALQLFPGTEYTLAFDAFASRVSASVELTQDDYSLEVYLIKEPSSNSKVYDKDTKGQLLGTLTPSFTSKKQNFENVQFNFNPKITETGEFGVRFIFYGGFWSIANVSIKPAQEAFFSPDEINILIPIRDYNQSLITFKTDFLDVNNNSAGVSITSLPTYFTGSSVLVNLITTYQNPGDNRVITSLGSGSLTGEPNLQFDGTTLSVTGSLNVSGSSTLRNIGPAQFTGSVNLSGSLTQVGTADIFGTLTLRSGQFLQGSLTYDPNGFITTNTGVALRSATGYYYADTYSSAAHLKLGFYNHSIATGPWPNLGDVVGLAYNQPIIQPDIAGYNMKLLSFTGTVTSSAVTTVNGLHTTLTDNSLAIANTLYGVYADVSAGTNTSATRYAAAFLGGNVGIGTSNPTTPLQVAGAISGSIVYASTRMAIATTGSSAHALDIQGRLNIRNSLTDYCRISANSNSDGPSQIVLTGQATALSLYANPQGGNQTGFAGDTYSAASSGIVSSGPLVLGANQSERVRITSTGNVGIGTTSPSATLHVQGAVSSSTLTTSGRVSIGTTSTNGMVTLSDRVGSNGTEILSLVGAASSGLNFIRFRNANNTSMGYVGFADNANVGNSLYLWNDINDAILLGTNNNERVRITSTGNVGIGTTSPTAKLTVSGSSQFLSGLTVYPTNEASPNWGGSFGSTFGLSYGGSTSFGYSPSSNTYRLHILTYQEGAADSGSVWWRIRENGGTANGNPVFQISIDNNGTPWAQNRALLSLPNYTARVSTGSGNYWIQVSHQFQGPSIFYDTTPDVYTINNSAILELASTTRGFLPPRMTSTQRDAITTPPTGLLVYQTTNNYYSVYNGTNWQNILSPNSSGNVGIGTTSPTEKLEVNGNIKVASCVSVGNATPSTSGAGITFPATQNASNDANTLDDYEEGTWTPAWAFSTSGTATAVSSNTSYTKIGRLVTVRCRIYTSAISSPTGNATITGLPFTAPSGQEYPAGAIAEAKQWNTDMPNLRCRVVNGTTTLEFSTSATNATTETLLAGSDFKSGGTDNVVSFTATYII